MTTGEANAFREVLEAEADALRRALQSWREIRPGDRRKEFSRILFDCGLRQLHDITAALRRIEEVSYGDCVDCGHAIPAPRLSAVPWTSRCVRCQEKRETVTV